MSSKTKATATAGETKPALVPKLRFPEFHGAEGWQRQQLADVCAKITQGGTPGTSKPEFWGGTISWMTPAEMGKTESPFIGSTNRTITELGLSDCASDLLPRNTVILSIRAPIGHLAINTVPIAINQGCKGLMAGESLNFYFLYCSLLDAKSQLIDLGAGNTFKELSGSALKSFVIAIPSLAEQEIIAECLSSVDELIAAQARKVDALKTQKKGLVQQLFPREGETQPRLRFSEFHRAGVWRLASFGELVDEGSLYPPKDGNHGNIHPKSSDYVASGIPFIMASDLNGGLVDIVNCHFIRREQADTLQKGFAKEGDVLLSHKGTVGEVAVVREIETPYIMLTPQVTYYRVKDHKKLSNEFLAQLFVSDQFQSHLAIASGGGTRAYIGIIEQAKLRVRLPKDLGEQQRIASFLSSLDALITAETQKLEALKTHKKGLMQQLFPSPVAVEA
jgi:type I restriction enzyme, S subunit